MKLPLEMAEHTFISQIFNYIRQSSIMFSSILYKPQESTTKFLINKNESTPYF